MGIADNLSVLLIGVDPPALDSAPHPSRSSSARDIRLMAHLFADRLGVAAERLVTLVAGGEGEPPTYDNVIAAMRRLGQVTAPGGHLYLHYSGYGARLPSLAGADREDEALVLLGTGGAPAAHLRDLEIARLLRDLPAGVTATLVLDCGIEAKIARGAGAVARGFGPVAVKAETPGGVAPDAELAASWIEGAGRWLPAGSRHALLRASSSTAPAYAYAFDGKAPNGALTYWVADSLKRVGGLTYGQLRDRVVVRVRSWFRTQCPVFVGDPAPIVLGLAEAPPPLTVPVLDIDYSQRRVRVGAGRLHGMRERMRLSISAEPTSRRSWGGSSTFEIDELYDDDCWARMATDDMSKVPVAAIG
jgi:hypothetical protein